MTDGTTAIQVSPISETEMRDSLNSFTSKAHDFITRVVSLSEQAVTLAALQETVKALSDRVTQAENTNSQLRAELENAQSLAVENKRTAEQWQRDHGIVLSDLNRAWTAHDERETEAKELAKERDGARADADSLRDKLEQAEARIRYLESALAQTEDDKRSLTDRVATLEAETVQVKQSVVTLTEQNKRLQNDVDTVHAEFDRVTHDRDDWKSSYYQINDKLATANINLAAVREAHNKMREVFDTATQSAQAA